jgi:hypothetical protein
MFRRTRFTTVAAAAASLFIAGCATLRVNSYVERGTDFTRYRSYAWAGREAFSTGDPRLDNNRFFSQRVEEAVDMQLAAKGFEKTNPGAADLLVHIHARVQQRLEASAFDPATHRCSAEDCGPRVYDSGTLLVDLIDRRTTTLAWRGWAEGSLDATIDNQRLMETTIDKTVAKIIARLPR